MKSRKEIGPSRAMRSRRRSESDTRDSIIFPPMRSRVASAIAVLATGALAACASHREPPLPTLEDYSDRVSVFAQKYLEDWKTGAKNPGFYAEGFSWAGPLPGDALQRVASRNPLAISIYR